MDQADDFRKKFALTGLNINNAIHLSGYQKTVIKFMDFVRKNAFRGSEGEELMQRFCIYVNHEKVWHLAEMVVPEFQESWSEQYDLPQHSQSTVNPQLTVFLSF